MNEVRLTGIVASGIDFNETIDIPYAAFDLAVEKNREGIGMVAFNGDMERMRRNASAYFFRISAWAKSAQLCRTSLFKGRRILVFGHLIQRAMDNGGESSLSMGIVCDKIEFLDSKERPASDGSFAGDIDDDEIPF